jgi:hypothetical protein
MEIEIRVALLHVPRFPTDYVMCCKSYSKEHKSLDYDWSH